MRYRQFGTTCIIRIDRGEEIVSTINEFCTGKRIFLGTVQGIGAVGNAEIGLFETATKKYHAKTLWGDLELTALLGSITTMNGAPYLHLHATITDSTHQAFGGHLKSAVVSGTCEVFITMLEGRVERVFDDETGLNLLDL